MKILVLPGIGDIYWVATILEDFARKRNGGKKPEVWIWDFDGRRRSLEYVERIPFVTAAGYWSHHHEVPEFRESYLENKRSVFPKFQEFDYYLSANGALRYGRTVEEAFKGYRTNWMFELGRTEREITLEEEYRLKFGKYFVAHFSNFGMFSSWTQRWMGARCASLVDLVQQKTGMPVLMTGCEWDRRFSGEVASQAKAINLAGQTDPDQFFALFRGAAGCLGWCGGNTIISTAFRVPTLMFWCDYFTDPRFFKNACPPEALGKWYEPVTVERENPRSAYHKFMTLLERNA